MLHCRNNQIISLAMACALILQLFTGCGNTANSVKPSPDPVEQAQSGGQVGSDAGKEDEPTPDPEPTTQTDAAGSESPNEANPEDLAEVGSTAESTPAGEPENPTEETLDPAAQARAEEEERARAEEEERARAEEEERRRAEEEKKMAEERNSFSMMYYLAITAEEIRTSRHNRLILDDIYTSLLNDINPGTIDEITQDHLKNLRDIIKSYLLIETKRDRLQFIYNQEKAAAIRSAVPNPLAILSVAGSMDWKRLAVSVVYTAVDSYKNYRGATENADMNFLMSGWELDDEEVATVQKNRDRAFDYMVDMVQAYHLDGRLTLNEKDIEKFAEISAIESVHERIRRFVSEESTYSLLGNYWLELADCYFETDQYRKCLDCIAKYNELSNDIYRKDYNYAKILPEAIVAAQKTYTGEAYITNVGSFAKELDQNTTKDDWSSRYFLAQVYLDLYTRTDNFSYLRNAYQIANDNVDRLLAEQRKLNEAYLNDVCELSVAEPDYRYLTAEEKKAKEKEYKEEKKRVNAYNKELKEARKTELPALYEPLVLNCELLFALSEKMCLGYIAKNEIEKVLQTATNGTFLTKPINDAYSFSSKDNRYTVSLTKDALTIPADLLTAESTIRITISENGNSTIIDDCVVSKVDRKGKTIDTFSAQISSNKWKKYEWTANSRVTITITYGDAYGKTTDFNFVVTEFQDHWYGDKVVFGQV